MRQLAVGEVCRLVIVDLKQQKGRGLDRIEADIVAAAARARARAQVWA